MTTGGTMRKLTMLVLMLGTVACGDFVDDEGNTSFRQVASGLQTLGDRVAEMGDAIERDADVEAVPWRDLLEVVPDEVDGARRVDSDGDEATDRNGAGLSVAHAKYAVDGDTVFVAVADLGALRSGVFLALRWVAPVISRADVDGDVDEMRIGGYPAIRVRGEDDDHQRDGILMALIAEGRFAVAAGAEDRVTEHVIREALENVDYGRLEDWADYGR
jgi:hypothetical protein